MNTKPTVITHLHHAANKLARASNRAGSDNLVLALEAAERIVRQLANALSNMNDDGRTPYRMTGAASKFDDFCSS